MPAARCTKRRFTLEARRGELIAWAGTEGATAAALAAHASCPRSTASAFLVRHRDEIETVRRVAAAGAVDHAIAKLEYRIVDAERRRRLMLDVIAARARAGETELEKTGIVVKTLKRLGFGKDAVIVKEYKVDVALLTEWRENDRHVAEQMHQLGKDADAGTDPGEVLIREVVVVRDVIKYLPAPGPDGERGNVHG